jgi:hypothetical protein
MSQIRYFQWYGPENCCITPEAVMSVGKRLYHLPETVISPTPSNPSLALIVRFHIISSSSKFKVPVITNWKVNKSSDEQISFSNYRRLVQVFELFDWWKEVHFLRLKDSQIISTVPLTNEIQWLSKLFIYFFSFILSWKHLFVFVFVRNFPIHCLQETPFETVSGRISPKWTKLGKHSQI